MLNKEVPFLRLVLPLCAGIVTGLYVSPGNTFFLGFLAIAISGFAISLFFNKSLTNILYGVTITSVLFTGGLFLYTYEKDSLSALESEEAVFSGILDDYPEEKEKSYMLTIKMKSRLGRNGIKTYPRGSMIIYCRKNSEMASFLPGDIILIRCSPAEIINRGNPCEFDYRFYMQNMGIRYFCFTDSSDIISHITPEKRSVSHSALIIRNKIIEMYRERGIKGEHLALVAAITLGQKSMLDPEQKQHFIKAGVMHIMAVSGLHAVILSMFILKMFFFLRGRFHIVRVALTILFLWAFAFVTGLTPSVLRAALMFSFLKAGDLMKRPVNSINSVLASAFLLILIKPSVIFDAGFLLSYSAVIFIISFYRDFYLKINFRYRITDLIWQSAAVTIIAQAGTLPLTLMLFNRFPTWFIISNIIIVPVSSLIIIIGALVPLTYPLQPLSRLMAVILDFLTGLTEFLTEKVSRLPFSTIENIGFPLPECILLMISIFLFTRFLLNKKLMPVIIPVTALFLFVLTGTIRIIVTKKTNELIVYNTSGFPAIGIRAGSILNLYTNTSLPIPEVSRHCAVMNLNEKRNIISGSMNCIIAGDEKILVTDNLSGLPVRMDHPEMLIYTGSRNVQGVSFNQLKKIEALIISSAISAPEIVNNIRADTVHYVKRTGGFRKRLRTR